MGAADEGSMARSETKRRRSAPRRIAAGVGIVLMIVGCGGALGWLAALAGLACCTDGATPFLGAFVGLSATAALLVGGFVFAVGLMVWFVARPHVRPGAPD